MKIIKDRHLHEGSIARNKAGYKGIEQSSKGLKNSRNLYFEQFFSDC